MNSKSQNKQEAYINRWYHNSKQHFDDGDYEWICDFISSNDRENSIRCLLEIGCGVGYSTLVFALRNFRVTAIDSNEYAISASEDLLKEHEIHISDTIMMDNADVCLLKRNIVEEYQIVKGLFNFNKPNLIVLCNPGGQFANELSGREWKLLLRNGFSVKEVSEILEEKKYPLLHKWALIYACCQLSKEINVPILIVERDGDKESLQRELEIVAEDTCVRLIRSDIRLITEAPTEGIRLLNQEGDSKSIFWGAAMYYPV